MDDRIKDIRADTASFPYISIIFAKRDGAMDGGTDGQTKQVIEILKPPLKLLQILLYAKQFL